MEHQLPLFIQCFVGIGTVTGGSSVTGPGVVVWPLDQKAINPPPSKAAAAAAPTMMRAHHSRRPCGLLMPHCPHPAACQLDLGGGYDSRSRPAPVAGVDITLTRSVLADLPPIHRRNRVYTRYGDWFAAVTACNSPSRPMLGASHGKRQRGMAHAIATDSATDPNRTGP